ncbi:MAG: phosphotransferase [Desulfobacterales bacterium]|uniref:Phosphotransferase n=1 Tax=Candidatus Desulfatibia profunda TaxID=2841695 RepID=A0A8J6NTW7_9BACT|nr:phosphotransferase [Candidatus Desulfatibia profunda]MBL7180506.1 phosphotransferase [Desulfobacterales bacterium]MBU0699527.1 phosphotransferase [Pseudomonadota bacterium]
MKALILAAGLGTRLLPFTESIPKPLFPIAGRPLLDIIICDLQQAGCRSIIINTHHLNHLIEAFIASQKYPIPVLTRHEPVILGTGGAIKNVADFWDDKPFMVINSDIITDIDLKKVYHFHLNHGHPVTLVLHDDPEFNTVSVNHSGFITGFLDKEFTLTPPSSTASSPKSSRFGTGKKDLGADAFGRETKNMAFTGIHVLNPEVLDLIPDKAFSSIIDIYRKLISEGGNVCAFISKNFHWKDIGTPQRYREAVFEKMAPKAFQQAFPNGSTHTIRCHPIKGDGSDRNWYRLHSRDRSLVMADHGIRHQSTTSEVDAFVLIGRHLCGKGIPVPRIFLYDTFSGLVFLEDLGNDNLQNLVQKSQRPDEIISSYKTVIDLLLKQSVEGAKGFDPSWAYQTDTYSRNLILDRECRYFVEAFLCGYLGMTSRFEDFEDDFFYLADKALEHAVNGFMHRDMQSRNIMVKDKQFYFIDFQGGRLGPIQYDLASLLIDPYVELPYPVQKQLVDYGIEKLSALIPVDPEHFCRGYHYCAVARNLQILGAFGYLSRNKGKTYFGNYIPAAVRSLKRNLSIFKNSELPNLKAVVEELPEL